MSISSALFSGVSGLNTLGNSMSVIGDNIANVNTIGFKSSRTTFETMLAQNITGASGTSQVGRGVALSAVDAVWGQGSFEGTGEATDMAIGGKGFFMVRSPETGTYYTRAGHFKFDEEGYLVNPASLRVQGWILDPNSIDPQGAITDIQINATSSAPNPTSEITMAVNLQNTSLFAQTPASITSDPITQSGFIFTNTVNDEITITETVGGATETIDLITLTAGSPLNAGEIYTGQEVADALQTALNDTAVANTLTSVYKVTYNPETSKFSITSSGGGHIDFATSTANETLGLSAAADTTLAATIAFTGNEIAYNITPTNDQFLISVDNGSSVAVFLADGYYTITELRKELEDKINSSLASNEQAATVDVRYDSLTNNFIISSSSRGTDTSIQVTAVEGDNNFLPTINMTDYTVHLGETSNGYTLPGFTESLRSNDSRFNITAANNALFVSGIDCTVSSLGYYTGSELAAAINSTLLAASSNVTLAYNIATDRFTFTNGAGDDTLDFSTSTMNKILGFTSVLDVTLSANSTLTSDNSTAFNIITADNDTLDIIVNENPVNSGTPINVTIDSGIYTGETLAIELENKINNALALAGESQTVYVTFEAESNKIRIASSTLGSNSSIQINSSMSITPDTGFVGGTLLMDDATINYGQGFDVLNPESGADGSSNYTTALVGYDSLGNQHTLSFYFRKAYVDDTAQTTQWEWFAYVPASDTLSGRAEAQARGILTFDQNGILKTQSDTTWLTTITTTDETTGDITSEPGTGFDFSGGAAPQQEVIIDFGRISGTNVSTQYASPSSTIFQTQDGFGSGFLQDVSVDTDGVVTGNYSNGQVLYLARVALANFVNPWGLSREGGNLYSKTRDSGQPITGTPGTAGMGKIAPNSLEQSNVDLATEFVNMIIQQRGFQANSKTITTTDEMLSELIALKR